MRMSSSKKERGCQENWEGQAGRVMTGEKGDRLGVQAEGQQGGQQEGQQDGRLLIIWHSRTGASKALAEAAWQGSGQSALLLPAQEIDAPIIRACSGYLFVCPENLASMSGLMKEMFDRNYYEVLGQIEGRAYSTIIAAGSDGEGAQRQIDRIATGWRLRRVADPMILSFNAQSEEAIARPKQLSPDQYEAARSLGEAMSQGLQMGVF